MYLTPSPSSSSSSSSSSSPSPSPSPVPRPSPSRIVELASIIATNTNQVDQHLSSHNLPPFSFEPNNTESYIYPVSVQAAQNAVLEATSELHDLMLGPTGILAQQLQSCNQLIGLHAIHRFQIAEKFPEDKDQISYSELSHKTGLPEVQLRRTLRQAMTQRIFTEPTKDTVAHTAASMMLTEPFVHDWIGWTCDEMWPACAKAVPALAKWPGSQEPMHTGFNLEKGTADPMFLHLVKHPPHAKQFAGFMSFRARANGDHLSHLLDGYPWSVPGAGVCTLVDVGGSQGLTSIALASYPNIICIVQDIQGTVARPSCTHPLYLQGRVRFMGHNYLADEQPVKGADIYFFRLIFHDWSDKWSARILRCLIGALKPGARVIIHDLVVPEWGAASLYEQRRHTHADLSMLAMCHGRERSAEEWGSLIQAADPRFRLVKIIRPRSANQGIIVIEWCGT